MNTPYDMIFRRKSIREFDCTFTLSAQELDDIRQKTGELKALFPDIRVQFVLTPWKNTTAKFGEYCLLLYSEKKPCYLLNAGYLLEQMDLFFAQRDIGACWYGMAKTAEKQLDGLEFVIMLAVGKSRPEAFRTEESEFTRKGLESLLCDGLEPDLARAVRLAPSACNSQPWALSQTGDCIRVSRVRGVRCLVPARFLNYFNAIDMGICLCFLELALEHRGDTFTRTLCTEEVGELPIAIADYALTRNVGE